jgi:hypothetical protein
MYQFCRMALPGQLLSYQTRQPGHIRQPSHTRQPKTK